MNFYGEVVRRAASSAMDSIGPGVVSLITIAILWFWKYSQGSPPPIAPLLLEMGAAAASVAFISLILFFIYFLIITPKRMRDEESGRAKTSGRYRKET